MSSWEANAPIFSAHGLFFAQKVQDKDVLAKHVEWPAVPLADKICAGCWSQWPLCTHPAERRATSCRGGPQSSLMFCTNGVLLRMLTRGDGLSDITHVRLKSEIS